MNLRMKELREVAGITRDQLGAILGVSGYTIKNWELQTRGIDLDTACLIADVLDCTLDELAGREVPGHRLDPGDERHLGRLHSLDPRSRAMVEASIDMALKSDDVAGEGMMLDA